MKQQSLDNDHVNEMSRHLDHQMEAYLKTANLDFVILMWYLDQTDPI